ncbi:hypothetical protein CCAN11_2190009 [Capnocytophaga canimorsus]|uniref:Uncharacterized protein n=1 Tax=Capnocytophaga canimorsus TaxID=28188 RepID=A0A0B7IL57_9FLAO|nr:hypothetical protein CCAN11_2190009 [Capnocytophaga canimorsus]
MPNQLELTNFIIKKQLAKLYNTMKNTIFVDASAQHSTAQHSTAQHSTAQHSTAQHSTAHKQLKNNIIYFGVKNPFDRALCPVKRIFTFQKTS